MPAKPADKPPDAGAREPGDTTRYRVLSGGISTPAGAVYRDEIVTDEQMGGAGRVAQLLARHAIEVAGD